MPAPPAATAVPSPSSSTQLQQQLWQPYRALGYVCNHVPAAAQTRGQTHFVTTAVGRAYHTYNCDKLNLVFVGQTGGSIDVLAAHGDLTLTASGSLIQGWRRGRESMRFTRHEAPVTALLPFGQFVISLSEDNILFVFDKDTGAVHGTLDDLASHSFVATCMAHPSTYLNKILLGGRDGRLQLWNIRTQSLIYSFSGWGSAVLALAQSPAVDVMAIGLQTGRIILHNIRTDRSLMSFLQDGPVTALSFRTDNNPILASSAPSGTVSVWDLEARRIATKITDAHNASIVSLCFLPSQPVLLTTGTDNAIKLWIFDDPSGNARLLKFRSGHSAPPTKIRYHGPSNRHLLSAGQDRTLRFFSTIVDSQNTELSQGSLAKKAVKLGMKPEDLKLPAIVDFASEAIREDDWDSIVTCHMGSPAARTWSFERKALGKHSLAIPEPESQGHAKCVAVSPCGNFAIVGLTSGHMHKYNLQSGALRGSFGSPKAHKDAVRGIACDSLDQTVVSASLDGTLKFWSFAKPRLLAVVELEAAVERIELHRDSSLLAAVTSDNVIRIVDIETRRTVRVFSGHESRVTDITWSPDARWLISASMDSTVRTWDVPTGRMLSWMRTPEPVTSCAMSPTGDFLTTTHVDSLGIFLWANRSLFANVSIRPVDAATSEPPEVLQLPNTGQADSSVGAQEAADTAATLADEDTADQDTYKTPDQLSDELITLSRLPRSRWANLTRLEDIKERNKPKQAPTAPARAPFFLTTIPGLSTTFKPLESQEMLEKAANGTQSRVLNFGNLQYQSPFQKVLVEAALAGRYSEIMAELKGMGMSAIDTEIRSLSLRNDGEQIRLFLDFAAHQLRAKNDFELLQPCLQLFLKVHGDFIASQPTMLTVLENVLEEQEIAWTRLDGLVQHISCMITFCKQTL